jgi:hypothetical protein
VAWLASAAVQTLPALLEPLRLQFRSEDGWSSAAMVAHSQHKGASRYAT